MNNLIELSNLNDISLNDIKLVSIDNTYVFLKYYNTLKKHKNIIDNYSKEWDSYKKYMNPYELIYSPYDRYINTSNYKPISRSFFKMWEMLNKFNLITIEDDIVIANIAEGPGGFIEAIFKYKKQNMNDLYLSNTLYPSNRNIPSWNKFKKFIQENNINCIKLLYCDLYNYDKVMEYIINFKNKKATFITADGGFDYSSDFNKQEEQSYHIIYSEIAIALAIQEEKGNFVIKIFDTFTLFTLKCIFLLQIFYSNVYLYKPLTSRVANSEKYVVCKGFKGINEELLTKILESIKTFPEKNPDITSIILSNDFIYEFDSYNKLFVDNQIEFIDKTLDIIKNKDNLNFDKIVEEQIKNAKEWCNTYDFKLFSK
jgi:23S rRNA U2552 (ribose-2'-O)-methylase RlmE/FtsJ